MLVKILKFILKKCNWSIKNEILNFLILENVDFSKNRTIALLKNRIEEIEKM